MSIMEKRCLVVKNEHIFGKNNERLFYGFRRIDAGEHFDIEKLIREHGEYRERFGDDGMESNPHYQQIIPYVLFRYGNRYFVYERLAGGEKRLYNLKSLGIGGHIDPGDFGNETLAQALRREFFEEVVYNGRFEPKLIGLINERGSGSGKDVQDVHLGVVFIVNGDNEEIDIAPEERESNRKVGLLTKEEIGKLYGQMEGWSKIVYDNVVKNNLF